MKKECLLCFKPLDSGKGFYDWLLREDVVCGECRSHFKVLDQWFVFQGIEVYACYLYNDFFQSCIYQYKEGRDVALSGMFFQLFKNKIDSYFHDCTLVVAPSNKMMIEKRGFHHLKKMVEGIGLPMMDLLMKDDMTVQKQLSKVERKRIGEHLKLIEREDYPKKVLLIDDVMTSGATVASCVHLLRSKGIEVKVCVLAMHPLLVDCCHKVKVKRVGLMVERAKSEVMRLNDLLLKNDKFR